MTFIHGTGGRTQMLVVHDDYTGCLLLLDKRRKTNPSPRLNMGAHNYPPQHPVLTTSILFYHYGFHNIYFSCHSYRLTQQILKSHAEYNRIGYKPTSVEFQQFIYLFRFQGIRHSHSKHLSTMHNHPYESHS